MNIKYEAITEEEYEELTKDIKPYEPELLKKYETIESDVELEIAEDPECVGGVCPVR